MTNSAAQAPEPVRQVASAAKAPVQVTTSASRTAPSTRLTTSTQPQTTSSLAPTRKPMPTRKVYQWLRRLTMIAVIAVTAGMILLSYGDSGRIGNSAAAVTSFQDLTDLKTNLSRAEIAAAIFALDPAASNKKTLTDALTALSDATVIAAASDIGSRDTVGLINREIISYNAALTSSYNLSDSQRRTAIATANTMVEKTALTLIDARISHCTDVISTNNDSVSVLGYLAIGIGGLAGLVTAAVVVARRSHRVLNVGLVGAAFAVGAMVAAPWYSIGVVDAAFATATGPVAVDQQTRTLLTSLLQARAAEFNAVIDTANTSSHNTGWTAAMTAVDNAAAALGTTPVKPATYRSEHNLFLQKLGTGTQAAAGYLLQDNPGWAEVSTAAVTAVSTSAASAESKSSEAVTILGSNTILYLVLGLAGTLSAHHGLTVRLKEYE